MPRLFGTDGIRGVANEDLTPELALAVGRAAGRVLAPEGGAVVVGRDTRLSGPMLEGALVAGLASAGTDVHLAGIVPTAAVAWLTVDAGAQGGAVISASHNPVADNGIKFFSSEGLKIGPDTEDRIEARIEEPEVPGRSRIGVASTVSLDDPLGRYIEYLLTSLPDQLSGLRVVLDCAYGAAWRAAPNAFKEAGAEVTTLHAEPDGARINVDCGSTNLALLARTVVAEGADIGLAFDGDADRVLAVDERGETVDGDRILGLAALRLHEDGRLKDDAVVVTVMANLGLKRALQERGIAVAVAPVGDRHVAQAMADRGIVLGGEQSGHIIFAEHSTTGDGILTGLQLTHIVRTSDEPVSRLAHFFEPFPQVLLNVPVGSKAKLEDADPVWSAVREAEDSLGEDGRVLVRASGTEPIVRVMVEATSEATARSTAEHLADVLRKGLA